jgi:5-methyltetrahydrofolate--homocysteine methyltransferase
MEDNMTDFLEQLKIRVMVVSIGLGVDMAKVGYIPSDNFAVWILENPDPYKKVLKSYIEYGADVLFIGSSAANKLRLKHLGLEDQAFRIARDGAKLGREVCPTNRYLCGGLGNLGQLLEPLGEISYEEAYKSYKEQVLAMAEAGIDVVWIITMSEIRATEAAIRAVKDNTNLPVIATMFFDPTPNGYRTMMGDGPKEVAENLDKAGADLIGTNCGSITPEQVTDVLKEMAQATNKPLAAKPNAGKPEVDRGKPVYHVSAEEMAIQVPVWIENGARVIGGCCGAKIEHLSKMAEVVRQVNM